MATTVADRVFLDTNILVYAQQALSPWHTQAVTRVQDLASAGHPLCVSRQIFREYLAVMSRPGALTSPVSMTALVTDVQTFEAQFSIVEDGPAVTAQLCALLTSIVCSGKQVHDANVVATMLAHGIPNLLTHNVADFARFSTHITVLPLVP